LAALLRSAQRFFINSERRLRPAAVMPCERFFALDFVDDWPAREELTLPPRASIACVMRSRSAWSSWRIWSLFTNHPFLPSRT